MATGRGRRPLPPSPGLPRVLQTAGFIFGGVPFLEAMRRRYGGAVTMTTLFDDGFVMVFDPDLVKAVFQGPVESLHAGEANALLGPILGDRSVLLLDGAEHLSHRRLMLPFFHGRQLNAHVQTMRLCADEEIRPVADRKAVQASAGHAGDHPERDAAGGLRVRARTST